MPSSAIKGTRTPSSAMSAKHEKWRLRYDIIDRYDEATGLSAMMRTTAFPASIIAQMMAKGEVLERGATPQERAIDAEQFVAELERRDIRIEVTTEKTEK